MNILITGNNGFIGRYLVKELISKGDSIVGVDLYQDSQSGSITKFIKGDICEKSLMREAIKGVDLIIHLAAKHHDFGVSREEFFRVNEEGTKNILDIAEEEGIKKIIFYSTVAVYGKEEADESTIPSPISDYGKSKLAAEKLIQEWVQKDSSRMAIIIRPTLVFGINNFGNIYNLIDKIISKRFFWVGEGSNIKSLAYIENLVAMTLFLTERMKPGLEIFNYSDEPHLTTRQIAETIAKYGNTSIPKLKIPYIIARVGGKILDIAGEITVIDFPITGARVKKFLTKTYFKAEKIRKLGFKQPVSLNTGFRKTIQWYLQQKNIG